MGLRLALLAVIVCFTRTATGEGPLDAHRGRIAAWQAKAEYAAIVEYCRQQLARTVITDAERHELTLHLSHAAIEQALTAPGEESIECWIIAAEAPLEYFQQSPANPRRVQLLIQAGVAHLARAESMFPLLDTSTDDVPARVPLREAIKRFREAREMIEETTRTAPRVLHGDPPPGAIAPFTVEQLRSLDRHAAYLLAKSYRRQAETYPAGSEDRLDAARQAEELFRGLAELLDQTPLAWPCRVQLIACQRLLEQWADAVQNVESYSEQGIPPEFAAMFQAERARLALAQQRHDAAIQLAEASDVVRSFDLDWALLEAYLAGAKQGWRESATNDERRRAARQIGAIGERWGAAFQARAVALLSSDLSEHQLAVDAAAWALAGDAAVRRGRSDAALSAYAQAQTIGTLDGDADAALQAGMKAAALENSRGDIEPAANRLRMLSLNHVEHPSAPHCHRQGIYLLALSDAAETKLPDWLREHIRIWPASPSAEQFQDWLQVPAHGLPSDRH